MNFLRRLFAPKRKHSVPATPTAIRFMRRWKRHLEFRIRQRARFAVNGSADDRRLMRNARKRERAAGYAASEMVIVIIVAMLTYLAITGLCKVIS